MNNRFGHMHDFILALRRHGIPLLALKMDFFTPEEWAWINDGCSASIAELMRPRLRALSDEEAEQLTKRAT